MVRGASVPYPYGGKPRVIMADLDQDAMQARGLTPSDVTEALQHQNVILPSGDVKIGSKDYTVAMNNSPNVIAAINNFPVKQINGKTVFVRDVAHVHDGYQVQTNSVSVNGAAGRADAGPQDRRRVDTRGYRRHQGCAPGHSPADPEMT